MSAQQYGPVDFYLVGIPDGRPDPAALSALTDLGAGGMLRLLDLVLISKSDVGEITVVEAIEDDDALGIDIALLAAVGIAGDEDIAEFAALMEDGTSAVLVAVELVYQRELAARVADAGAVLLGFERIPAPIVNALMDSVESTEEG